MWTALLCFLTSVVAHQVYTTANVVGYGDLDYASVIKVLENTAGMDTKAG